jgi:Family of unknown function (DUF6188)
MTYSQEHDGWLLPVARGQVTRVCVDNAEVKILCNGVEISIGGQFFMTNSNGERFIIDPSPSGDASHLAPFLRIVRRTVEEAIAFTDGRLSVTIDDGTLIEVPVDPQFEAWNAAGPGGIDGLKVVSLPGGELAIWKDRRQTGEQSNP